MARPQIVYVDDEKRFDDKLLENFLFLFAANQEWEQNLRIYNLQLERERLKTRRQEIAKLNVSAHVN